MHAALAVPPSCHIAQSLLLINTWNSTKLISGRQQAQATVCTACDKPRYVLLPLVAHPVQPDMAGRHMLSCPWSGPNPWHTLVHRCSWPDAPPLHAATLLHSPSTCMLGLQPSSLNIDYTKHHPPSSAVQLCDNTLFTLKQHVAHLCCPV
jgi:hypothetical protein